MSEVIKFDEREVDTSIAGEVWRSGMRKKGVDVYFKIDRFTHQRVMLGVTTVTGDIRDAVEFIQDPNTRFKYDNLVKENYKLETFDETTSFYFTSLQTKACMLNFCIDICYLATSRCIGDKHLVGYTSILDNPFAPSVADVQRAWLYHSGFVLEPLVGEENKFKIFYLMHVDLRINELQHATKNTLLEKHILCLVQLRECLETMEHRKSRFKQDLPLDEQNPFDVEEIPLDESLDMNLASMNTGQPYNPPKRVTNRTYSDDSSRLDINSREMNFSRKLQGGEPPFDEESRPDLFFWSLDGDDQGESLEDVSDYVTMGNSAAASLFREYINVLEAVRFSSVCPEKLSWRVLEKNDEVWTLEKIGSAIQCMAGVANIRATETEIADFLRDPRSRFTYDQTLYKTNVVTDINPDLRLIYAHHKAKHCLIGHGRDFLYFQYDRREGDKRILASASCTHPKCPLDPDIIRGTMYETGFIIEPLPETGMSSVVYVVKIEPGGNIPEALLRWFKRKQPKVLFDIKKYFER
ncbi:hypothetical protein ACHWQZ_G000013 [Mnemiopsis leidyi]